MKSAHYSGFMFTFLSEHVVIHLHQTQVASQLVLLIAIDFTLSDYESAVVWLYILSLHYYCMLLYLSLTIHNPSKQLHMISDQLLYGGKVNILYQMLQKYVPASVATMQTCEILRQESPIWQSSNHEKLWINGRAQLSTKVQEDFFKVPRSHIKAPK